MPNYRESELIKLETFHGFLANWEVCYLCGEQVIWSAATRDHIIPAAMGGLPKRCHGRARSTHNNLALAHYLCNNLRQNYSVLDTSSYLEYVKKKLGSQFFFELANELKPNGFDSVQRQFNHIDHNNFGTIEQWVAFRKKFKAAKAHAKAKNSQ